MKRFIAIVLALALVAGASFGQSAGEKSGFKLGHVSVAGNDLYGGAPFNGAIYRVTQVTSTTVFYVELLKGYGNGVGSQTLADFPVISYSCLFVQASDTLNDNCARAISAFDVTSGKITLVVPLYATPSTGDVIGIAPRSEINRPMTFTTTNVAYGAALRAFRFQGSGIFRVDALWGRVSKANSATGTNILMGVNTYDKFVANWTTIGTANAIQGDGIGTVYYCVLDTIKAIQEASAGAPFYMASRFRDGLYWSTTAGIGSGFSLCTPDTTWLIGDSTSAANTGQARWSVTVTPLTANWQIRKVSGN